MNSKQPNSAPKGKNHHVLFSDLLEKCGDSAYNYAYYLAGNSSDASDLVQSAFMKALENISKYDPEKPFAPWLKSILHNLYVDSVKRYEKTHGVSMDAPSPVDDQSWADILPSNEQEPLQILQQEEKQKLVRKALEKIDPIYRSAIILSDLEGFSYEEISQIIKCPVGTVRSRIHRGRILLKVILEPLL